MSIENLLTISLFVLGAAIAIPMAIKASKRQKLENEQIARDLGWNVHTGLYRFLNVSAPIDHGYFFFRRYPRGSGSSYYFHGKYKNYDFVLSPFVIPQGKYGQLNYLIAELKDVSEKNYDFFVLSQSEDDLFYKNVTLREYKKVRLESNEFNKEFAVYAKEAQDVFYHLPPDRMFKLLSVKAASAINKLFIEVRQNSILVCGDYSPYLDFVKGQNEASKKEILQGFMDKVVEISKIV